MSTNPSQEVFSPSEATKVQKENGSLSVSRRNKRQEEEIDVDRNVLRKKKRYSQSSPMLNYGYSLDLREWKIFNLLHEEFASQIYMVLVFENDSGALIVLNDKMVYAIGANSYGRLGIGNINNTFKPKIVKGLCKKNIKTLYCNDMNSTFALTEEGEVYSWGHNKNYRLGQGLNSAEIINIPVKIFNGKLIIDISCSRFHFLALTYCGEVYIWGDSGCVTIFDDFQRGLPCQVKHNLKGEKIINIACGTLFNMALSNEGKLFSWGKNEQGQLGLGNSKTEKSPCLITLLEHVTIVKVVCGFDHSLALTTNGKIYSWGKNDRGQLGHGKNIKQEIVPIRLDELKIGKVIDIAAQDDKSVATNEQGFIYVWGCSWFGVTIFAPQTMENINIYDIFKYKLSYIIYDKKSNILKCLEESFDDPSTSDLAFQVEGQLIHVNKFILKIRCQYFKTMFQNNWAENSQSIIEHGQFSYNVYKAFLKYLYTSTIDLPLEETLELIKLADAYNEDNLKRKCMQIVKDYVTVSNVAFIYGKAIEYNAKDVEEFSFQFALSHMTEVVQTENFWKLNENLKHDFTIKAAKAGVYKT